MNSTIGRIRKLRFVATIGVLFLCTSYKPALSQDLKIENENHLLTWTLNEPYEWTSSFDFGDIAIGESQTATFNFSSLGPSEVWLYTIALTANLHDISGVSPVENEYTLSAFSFDNTDYIWNEPSADGTPRVGIPRAMSVGEKFSVDILFAPTSLGDFSTYLYVASNDCVAEPGTQTWIHLTGSSGAAAVPEPVTILLLGFGLIGLVGLHRKLQ